jgi:hypothetical protein
MAILTTARAALRRIELDTELPEGWQPAFDETIRMLDACNGIGMFAISARDIDPDTRMPTSLYFNVAPGFIQGSAFVTPIAAATGLLAVASTTTYVWVTAVGVVQVGSAWPTSGGFHPIGTVDADASKIVPTADGGVFTDYRFATSFIGPPISFGYRAVATNDAATLADGYLDFNCAAAAIVETLPDPRTCKNQVFVCHKDDTTANTLTIRAAFGTVDGAATVVMSARSTRWFISDGSNYKAAS